ncbi:MAG TPA: pentapeptide repeat-containing protein [Actinospica sp.]|nr:pentapeptide repeat-containing protein [Actinospica sp.]
MSWGGWKRYALVGILILAVMAAFGFLYGELPWWVDGERLHGLGAKDQADILNADRGDVLKMVAGAGAIVALVYTARKHALDRQAHALSEQGQVTDRYTKAITQLASEKESERIGGIYALERIMADSERDHSTVVEVLAAYVRQHAQPDTSDASRSRNVSATRIERMRARVPHPKAQPARVTNDVQAAMTVLARRPERDEPFPVDLRRTSLVGLELPLYARLAGVLLAEADLTRARLDGATLTGADLRRATLTRADLGGATLTEANFHQATLNRAFLEEATLTGADLGMATLTGAHLRDATLTGAYLGMATLTGAYLEGATLTGAKLDASQLADAMVMSTTKVPDALAADPWVCARIEVCETWNPGDPLPHPTPNPAA